jgi:hypothetical protein
MGNEGKMTKKEHIQEKKDEKYCENRKKKRETKLQIA